MLRKCNKLTAPGGEIIRKVVLEGRPLAKSHRLLGTGGLVGDRKARPGIETYTGDLTE